MAKKKYLILLIVIIMISFFLSYYVSIDIKNDNRFTNPTKKILDVKMKNGQKFVIEYEENEELLFLNRYDENKNLLYSNRIQNYENVKIDSIYGHIIIINYNSIPLSSPDSVLYDTLSVTKELPLHFFYNGEDTIIYKYTKRGSG